MSKLEEITTQEQLDTALENARAEVRKEYEGFLSSEAVDKKYEGFLSPEDVAKKYEGFLSPEDVAKKYEGYLSPEEASKKDAAIKGYEKESMKIKVAQKHGIPYEIAGRLSGETEEDMEKDAGILAGFLRKQNPYPDYSTEPGDGKSDKKTALKRTLDKLRGE